MKPHSNANNPKPSAPKSSQPGLRQDFTKGMSFRFRPVVHQNNAITTTKIAKNPRSMTGMISGHPRNIRYASIPAIIKTIRRRIIVPPPFL
jgi:hypothetical protein